MTKTQKVTDFSIVDHGIENCQYFQGCGTAFTPYEHVVTGIGDDFLEALDDCLEAITQQFDIGDTEKLIKADYGDYASRYDSESVSELYEDSEDIYYHVSIRYNVA